MEYILKIGNWEELKFELKKRFPQLTEVDLQYKGIESVLRMVAYKLHKTKEEMREIIEEIVYFS